MVNFRPRHERAYGNRPPTAEEMNFCLPYLRAQLEIVQPKVIVALGKTATDGLLEVQIRREGLDRCGGIGMSIVAFQ